jgi:nicotinamidase-related amidase
LIHTEILMNTLTTKLVLAVTLLTLASAAGAALPDPGMEIVAGRTALLITDPQNDFLSPDGVTWGVVGESVKANNTVANIDALFKAAKANDIPVFVSPHYYYPTDHGWKFEGALETLMHAIGMFDRKGALTTEGFEGSGADWLEQYKKYIDDGATVVSNPHKVYGPETNDMVLQLRKRGIDKVILGGMSANLCTESHMRELHRRCDCRRRQRLRSRPGQLPVYRQHRVDDQRSRAKNDAVGAGAVTFFPYEQAERKSGHEYIDDLCVAVLAERSGHRAARKMGTHTPFK